MTAPTESPRAPRRPGPVTRTVGVLGEVLLTLGVLGLLFVVWEVWWTGLGADAERDRAAGELYAQLDHQQDGADATEDDEPSADLIHDLAEDTEVIGMLYVPRLEEDGTLPIREGVGSDSIDRIAVGHYPTTQMPGEPGNFALAGHRDIYGRILYDQDQLVPGDRIYVQSPDGYFTYEVTESYVVPPDRTEVLEPVPGAPGEDPGDASVLTLATCDPPYVASDRLITHADFVEATPLSEGPPEAITDRVEAAADAGTGPAAEGED
ncbi:class E sortase [Nesterenkonia marinintestina]|uniref:class E sortase n=1 Tax=Nesterenkonia marinintestina TaxID=2979865 RepID=UPI0021C1B799|nr:class E sortase [Nesterenkonia sp. GX14115]